MIGISSCVLPSDQHAVHTGQQGTVKINIGLKMECALLDMAWRLVLCLRKETHKMIFDDHSEERRTVVMNMITAQITTLASDCATIRLVADAIGIAARGHTASILQRLER